MEILEIVQPNPFCTGQGDELTRPDIILRSNRVSTVCGGVTPRMDWLRSSGWTGFVPQDVVIGAYCLPSWMSDDNITLSLLINNDSMKHCMLIAKIGCIWKIRPWK